MHSLAQCTYTHAHPSAQHILLHNYNVTITNVNNTILSLSLFQFHFAVSPFSKLLHNFFYLISQSFPSLFYLILQSLPLRVIPYLFLFDFAISPSSRYSIIFFYMIFFLSPFSKATCFNDWNLYLILQFFKKFHKQVCVISQILSILSSLSLSPKWFHCIHFNSNFIFSVSPFNIWKLSVWCLILSQIRELHRFKAIMKIMFCFFSSMSVYMSIWNSLFTITSDWLHFL